MTLISYDGPRTLEEMHAAYKARQAKYGLEALKLRQAQELSRRVRAERERQAEILQSDHEKQYNKPEVLIKRVDLPPEGRNFNTKLTPDSVAYIRANPDRLTNRQLAIKFGVSESATSKVIKGLSWKEVAVENVGVDAAIRPKICTRKDAWNAILAVAEERNVTVDNILGPSRVSHICAARFEAIRAVAKAVNWEPTRRNCACAPGWTLARMKKLFNRDHTTILHALGRTKRARERGINP